MDEFRRVWVRTAMDFEQAKARPSPTRDPAVRFAHAEAIAILQTLETGSGPAAVRDAFEQAIDHRGSTGPTATDA